MAKTKESPGASQDVDPQEGERNGRAAAPLGVPLGEAHLRPGHRRRRRTRRWPRRRRLDETLKGALGGPKKSDKAKKIGAAIAERCKAKGIEEVVFDRNGYIYHGRVQALADAAREAGLKF